MSDAQLRGLFVTGSDTGIGKTAVTAAILHRLRGEGVRVGVYKPAVSGAMVTGNGSPRWDDVERLRDALGIDAAALADDVISPQRFRAPLAPLLAAQMEGRQVDEGRLLSGLDFWRGRAEIVVVEGAGGLLSPLSDRLLNADLARQMGFPLIVVCRRGLGAINQALLTVDAARHRGLKVAAVILNQGAIPESAVLSSDPSLVSNADQLRHWLPQTPVVETRYALDGDLRNDPAFRTINWLSFMNDTDHTASAAEK